MLVFERRVEKDENLKPFFYSQPEDDGSRGESVKKCMLTCTLLTRSAMTTSISLLRALPAEWRLN